MSNVQIRGNVLKVLSYGAGGGAIFALEKSPLSVVRVVADYRTMRRPPIPGEVFIICGRFERHPYYGRQFVAESLMCARPKGLEICGLLIRHPVFGKLSKRQVDKVWSQAGETIYELLDRKDFVSLHRTGLPARSALTIVRAWSMYLAEIKSAEAILKWTHPGPSDLELHRRVALLLGLSVDNPYRYVPELPWPDVDARASDSFPRADDERLIGACLSLFSHRQIANLAPFPEDAYRRRLEERLGDRKLARTAIQKSVDAGLIEAITLSGKRQIISSSHRLLCERFVSRLFAKLPSDKNLFSLPSHFDYGAPNTCCTRLIVFCDGMTSLEASEGLCYLFPDAVHVVPFSHSTNVTPASGRAIKITANELLSDSRAGIDSAKVAVLHMTDGYDLLGLNKILHHLPKDMQVILAGRSVASVRTARPMPFHTLAQRRPISVGYLTAAGLSNEKPRSKSRHLDEFPSSLSNKLLEVKSKNEALVSLCRSYRVARSTGTAVILCDDPLLRRKINAELQAELSENANPSISQSSTIAVAAGGEASAGSPMTWSGSDWARMQLPGEPMEFLEAYVHPQLRIEGAIPEMVKGRVARADSTIIDVTLSDARRLVLAYALSPSQSVLGAWDTVIIYCGGQTKSYPQWVYAASTAATSLVVVVRAHVRTRERATDWDSSDLLLSTYIS